MRERIKNCLASFLLVLAFGMVVSACASEKQPAPFTEYWPGFREAMLAENWQQVAELSVFPMEIKGVADSDPIQQLSQAEFITLLPSVLTQTRYVMENGLPVEKPLKELLEESSEVKPEMVLAEDIVRVHNFLFVIHKGEWKLARVYMEE